MSDGSAINLLSSILVSDMTSGGAAVACARLRKGLVDAGQKARWFALKGEPGRGALITDWIPGRVFLAQRLISRFCSRWQGADSHLNDITMADGLKRRSAGVINLHNLHEGMSFGFLQRLPADVPIVWTLHDMWPLTGYCCYSYSCSKYIAGCPGDCPQANLWGAMTKKPGQEWRRRQLFFLKNSARVSFVSPSKWLANCARERLPPNMSVNVIPNGIPIDVFRPIGNKIAVRQVLNLPLDGAIVLCGAQTVSDPRKGTRFLIDALKKIREKRRDSIKVVAFGYKPSDGTLPDDWVHTGTIHDEALLNLYYNAADVFVLPSLADNLPNTLIEATAAGTPSVTFDSGGCAEVVRDGANGFVARAGDAGHLAECIEKVLAMKDDQRLEMGEACRQIALREYDPKMQAQRYIELFESIQSRRQFSQ